MPMARPLCLAFQGDRHAASIDDQFMFGDAFLVAPVVEPQHAREGAAARLVPSRRVYIPAGRWFDFWEGGLTGGPQITRLQAPIHRMPLLVRAGSVVPAWPVMQHTGEHPVERLILHVYPGNGQSVLYEDDGETWAFQQGDWRLTHMTCTLRQTAEESFLQVERTTEGPFTPAYERIQVQLHGLSSPPEVCLADGAPVELARFSSRTRTATLETGLFRTLVARFAPDGSRPETGSGTTP
jgi:alpha-glucosidase